MFDPGNTSYVFLDNDLHARAISDLLGKALKGAPGNLVQIRAGWGQRPVLSAAQIGGLRDDVVICGFRDPDMERRIAAARPPGDRQRAIHHLNSHFLANLNRVLIPERCRVSLLEQLAGLFGVDLAKQSAEGCRMDLIVANEQGGFPALFRSAWKLAYQDGETPAPLPDAAMKPDPEAWKLGDGASLENLPERPANTGKAEADALRRTFDLVAAKRSQLPALARLRAADIRISQHAKGPDTSNPLLAKPWKKTVDGDIWEVVQRAAEALVDQDRHPVLPRLLDPAEYPERLARLAPVAASPPFADQAVIAGKRLRLRVLGTGRDAPGDPCLHLVEANPAYRPFIADILYLWRILRTGRPPLEPMQILAVFTKDVPDRPPGTAADDPPDAAAVEYYGPPDDFPILEELTREGGKGDGPWARLSVYGGGCDEAFFGAEPRWGRGGSELNQLADALLNNVLRGNRPVQRWRTTFTQAFDLSPDEKDPKARGNAWRHLRDALNDRSDAPDSPAGSDRPWVKRLIAGNQERRYFSSFTADTIAPGCNEPGDGQLLHSYEIAPPQGARLILVRPFWVRPLVAPLRRLRLHLFHGQTAILEWTIGDGDESLWADCGQSLVREVRPNEKSRNDPPAENWWAFFAPATAGGPPVPPFARLADCAGRPVPVTLALLLDINATARFTFSTIEEGAWGAGVPLHALTALHTAAGIRGVVARGKRVESNAQEGWLAVLFRHATLGQCPSALERCALGDERAQVIASAVCAGALPTLGLARERFAALRQRFATVDDYGEGPFYDAEFGAREYDRAAYRRFEDQGSIFAATDHSFTFLGFGWFPLNVIHHLHMPTFYRRLFLVRQFYEAILAVFAGEAAALAGRIAAWKDAAGGELGKDESALLGQREDLQRRLLTFGERVWFEVVTPQIQGRELFRKMCDQSPIRAEYEIIDKGVKDTGAFLQERAVIREEREERRQTGLLFLLTVIGLPFLTFFTLTDNQVPPQFRTWLDWLEGAVRCLDWWPASCAPTTDHVAFALGVFLTALILLVHAFRGRLTCKGTFRDGWENLCNMKLEAIALVFVSFAGLWIL